jgi:hypothetical protein
MSGDPSDLATATLLLGTAIAGLVFELACARFYLRHG